MNSVSNFTHFAMFNALNYIGISMKQRLFLRLTLMLFSNLEPLDQDICYYSHHPDVIFIHHFFDILQTELIAHFLCSIFWIPNIKIIICRTRFPTRIVRYENFSSNLAISKYVFFTKIFHFGDLNKFLLKTSSFLSGI